jgi:hypothetical protein
MKNNTRCDSPASEDYDDENKGKKKKISVIRLINML